MSNSDTIGMLITVLVIGILLGCAVTHGCQYLQSQVEVRWR